VELVVVVIHFFAKVFVCFTSGGGVKLVTELVQIFPIMAELITPLLAFCQQSLVFCCTNHCVFDLSKAIMLHSN